MISLFLDEDYFVIDRHFEYFTQRKRSSIGMIGNLSSLLIFHFAISNYRSTFCRSVTRRNTEFIKIYNIYFSNNFLKDSSKSLAVHHLLPRLSVLRIINLNLISKNNQTDPRSFDHNPFVHASAIYFHRD